MNAEVAAVSRLRLDDPSNPPSGTGLAYVSRSGSFTVRNGRCRAIQRPRHVGFYIDGTVWHYENDSDWEQVVSYALTGHRPKSRFHNRYGANCEVWRSDLPTGANARSFSQATGSP